MDLLKIIQLGLTFLDEQGNLPEAGPSTWQFNFKFNLTEDMYAEESVGLLQNSGIQFSKHEQEGINPNMFAGELFTNMVFSKCICLTNNHPFFRANDFVWFGADASGQVAIVPCWL